MHPYTVMLRRSEDETYLTHVLALSPKGAIDEARREMADGQAPVLLVLPGLHYDQTPEDV